MNMFENLLNSIPRNRLDYVNELEIPEITLSPYIWADPEDSLSSISESIISGGLEECERGTVSTASSIPLSRAMTDSDIDYDRYKRYKRLNYTYPWDHMRYAMERFPTDYVASLNRYMPKDPVDGLADIPDRPYRYITYDEDFRRRTKRFFDEECTFFASDDPGLLELRDAVRNLDLKALNLEACDLDHMRYLNYTDPYYKYPYYRYSYYRYPYNRYSYYKYPYYRYSSYPYYRYPYYWRSRYWRSTDNLSSG